MITAKRTDAFVPSWEYGLSEALKEKIRKYWREIKETLSDDFINNFACLLEFELDKYAPGIALCLLSAETFAPGGELYEAFVENNIADKEQIIFYTIRECHREIHENKTFIENEVLIQKIIELWPFVKKYFFKNKYEVDKFINSQASELYIYHFNLGLNLRNSILTPGSDLCQQFNEIGIIHADEMSSIMIRTWHRTLREIKQTEIKIEQIDFTTRTYNALTRAGFNSIESLLAIDDIYGLWKTRNLGKIGLSEVIDKMRGQGYVEWADKMESEAYVNKWYVNCLNR